MTVYYTVIKNTYTQPLSLHVQVYRCIQLAHQSLYKKDSLLPDVCNTVIDVDDSIFFHLLQHGVQYNECPCPTYSCTAMDQEVFGLSPRMGLTNSTGEINKGHSTAGDVMIWPSCVMELSHLQWS